MGKISDIEYMKLALKLALKAKDKTYPNPMVGAVIVRNGRVIGRGYHRKAGCAHAEVQAIENASMSCSGSTMFVTLEPCNHYGKTPPCTDAIIKSGIKKVSVAMKDPNPVNSGRGIKKLRQAGIEVKIGLCNDEAKSLNRKYIKFITTGFPYITVKLAESLDGKIAARDGTSKWISSGFSRRYVRKIRSNFNAIIIGSNTALTDDPFLFAETKQRYNTARIIADSRLRIPTDSNIIRTADKSPVIIGTTELAKRSRIDKFRRIQGVEVIVTKSRRSKVSLKPFLKQLAGKGMVNILVEGGGRLTGNLMDESLVDEVMFFISPKIIGGSCSSIQGRGVSNIREAIKLYNVKVQNMKDDILVRGYINNKV